MPGLATNCSWSFHWAFAPWGPVSESCRANPGCHTPNYFRYVFYWTSLYQNGDRTNSNGISAVSITLDLRCEAPSEHLKSSGLLQPWERRVKHCKTPFAESHPHGNNLVPKTTFVQDHGAVHFLHSSALRLEKLAQPESQGDRHFRHSFLHVSSVRFTLSYRSRMANFVFLQEPFVLV